MSRKGTKFISVLMAVLFIISAVAIPVGGVTTAQAVTREQAEEKGYHYAGYFYAAKGQPMVFKDVQDKGTIKIVSDGGNKCKVSKNKITVICKKDGAIMYKINGKKKYFDIIIGGNEPDKITKADYDLAADDSDGTPYDGKTYKNAVDCVRAIKKNVEAGKEDSQWARVYWTWEKEDLKDMSKYNRGVKAGTTIDEVLVKYPSWQDTDGTEVWCARYYDKKSGYVFQKVFYFDSKGKVNELMYYAYNPKAKENIIELQAW